MNRHLNGIAVPGLRWTVAVVVLWESLQFALSRSAMHHFAQIGLPQWIRPALGGAEIIAVLLFLVPAARSVGGYLLLSIFAIAGVLHFLHAEFNVGGLVVYGMAVIVCMTHPNREEWRRHMTDDEFIAGFEDCSLANHSFHHADHVRMAFLYLCRYPALEALQRFSTSLARFAAANGKPGLYNETVTWAFLLLIHDRMARAGCQQTWTQFAASNRDLLNWKDNVLKKYYRDETLSSELARNTFLFPDKIITHA